MLCPTPLPYTLTTHPRAPHPSALHAQSKQEKIKEAEARARNWDMAVYKQLSASIVTCTGCGAWPLVAVGSLYLDREAAWCRYGCERCGRPPDHETWFPLAEDTRGALVSQQLCERIAAKQPVNPLASRKHQHLWCVENRAALNKVRDARYDAWGQAAFNLSYSAMKHDLYKLELPDKLTFTAEEAAVLRERNISVPVGEFRCPEHAGRIDAAHAEVLRTLAQRDGLTPVQEPTANQTFFFHVDSSQMISEADLLEHYRRQTRRQPLPAQDCEIPFVRKWLQPNREPEKYHLANEYMRDMVRRRSGEVFPDDSDAALLAERACRVSIYNKVTQAAGHPEVGGICYHIVDLADVVCRVFSPTGLRLHPSVLQRFLAGAYED